MEGGGGRRARARSARGATEDEKRAGRGETVEERSQHPSSRRVSSRARGAGARDALEVTLTISRRLRLRERRERGEVRGRQMQPAAKALSSRESARSKRWGEAAGPLFAPGWTRAIARRRRPRPGARVRARSRRHPGARGKAGRRTFGCEVERDERLPRIARAPGCLRRRMRSESDPTRMERANGGRNGWPSASVPAITRANSLDFIFNTPASPSSHQNIGLSHSVPLPTVATAVMTAGTAMKMANPTVSSFQNPSPTYSSPAHLSE